MSNRIFGNGGKNLMSIRHEPKRNEITGEALIEVQKLIDLVSVFDKIQPGAIKEKKQKQSIIEEVVTHVLVKELITVYKWSYQLCSMATFLPIFSDIIKNDKVKIEDVPKFDSLMYKVMGE